MKIFNPLQPDEEVKKYMNLGKNFMKLENELIAFLKDLKINYPDEFYDLQWEKTINESNITIKIFFGIKNE